MANQQGSKRLAEGGEQKRVSVGFQPFCINDNATKET
jgi:hypothetical protein